jgi:hypothetical protein
MAEPAVRFETAPGRRDAYDRDMASQSDPVEGQEQPTRLDTMIAEFRAARQRRLEKQGIALWNRTESAFREAAAKGDSPPSKLP